MKNNLTITMNVLRKLSRKNNPFSRYIVFKLNRNIMTTSSRAEKATEELKNNPYYDKYAKKIASFQQTSPEEFLSRVEQIEKKKTKPKRPEIGDRQFSHLLEAKKKLLTDEIPQDESLDKIMKVDLIKEKTTDEIKQIWQDYHIHKDVIAATISSADYEVINAQLKKYPTFLLPLPRSQGYEFIMLQSHGNTVHFTPLICYQVHKENAPECLTITHYTEFKDSKGIVLMRGEFDKNTIDVKEAQCLANQLQLYYNQKDEAKTKLLQEFTETPSKFEHINLIKQIEDIRLI